VQRQHARGAQHHVVVAQAGLHQRHARQFALGQHLAVGVHHHPGAVQVQAGFHQQALTDFEAAAAFHGVQVQGGQGAVKVAHRAQEWGWQGVGFPGGPQARNLELAPARGFAFTRAVDGTRCLQSAE